MKPGTAAYTTGHSSRTEKGGGTWRWITAKRQKAYAYDTA